MPKKKYLTGPVLSNAEGFTQLDNRRHLTGQAQLDDNESIIARERNT